MVSRILAGRYELLEKVTSVKKKVIILYSSVMLYGLYNQASVCHTLQKSGIKKS